MKHHTEYVVSKTRLLKVLKKFGFSEMNHMIDPEQTCRELILLSEGESVFTTNPFALHVTSFRTGQRIPLRLKDGYSYYIMVYCDVFGIPIRVYYGKIFRLLIANYYQDKFLLWEKHLLDVVLDFLG